MTRGASQAEFEAAVATLRDTATRIATPPNWRDWRAREIEAWVDEQLERMRPRSLMYGGTPLGVEMRIWGLLEAYFKFCLDDKPGIDDYLEFRQQHVRRCPGPMAISQWFTDKKYGDPEMRGVRKRDRDSVAGEKIVDHFIAYKAWLKERCKPGP